MATSRQVKNERQPAQRTAGMTSRNELHLLTAIGFRRRESDRGEAESPMSWLTTSSAKSTRPRYVARPPERYRVLDGACRETATSSQARRGIGWR
jgi:hypothetical protein